MYKGLASLVEALRAGGDVRFGDYAPYLYRLDELLALTSDDVELLHAWRSKVWEQAISNRQQALKIGRMIGEEVDGAR